MARKGDFKKRSRESALLANRLSNTGSIAGIWIATAYEGLQSQGLIYYCENCKFCHTDRKYFDVDHLVPLAEFNATNSPNAPNIALNMVVLCKSLEKGDYGCNQRKGSQLEVPGGSGLAITYADIDMNCMPFHLRHANEPFNPY